MPRIPAKKILSLDTETTGLRQLDPYEGPFAKWGKWRLILNGREYRPIFKTYKEWFKYFDHA